MIDKRDKKGRSKYARKILLRRRLCRKLGLPDTPYPALWQLLGHKQPWQK